MPEPKTVVTYASIMSVKNRLLVMIRVLMPRIAPGPLMVVLIACPMIPDLAMSAGLQLPVMWLVPGTASALVLKMAVISARAGLVKPRLAVWLAPGMVNALEPKTAVLFV